MARLAREPKCLIFRDHPNQKVPGQPDQPDQPGLPGLHRLLALTPPMNPLTGLTGLLRRDRLLPGPFVAIVSLTRSFGSSRVYLPWFPLDFNFFPLQIRTSHIFSAHVHIPFSAPAPVGSRGPLLPIHLSLFFMVFSSRWTWTKPRVLLNTIILVFPWSPTLATSLSI